MHCKYQLDDAFAYLDGESESSEHYRQHIDECVTCQAFLADVEAARSVWNQVADVDLVNVDWNHLDRAVRESVAPPREDAAIPWLPAIGRGLVWAGAAAVLVMVFYVGFSRTGTAPADKMIADSSDTPASQELHQLELGELVTTRGRSKTVQVADAKLELAQGSLCRVSKLSATETTINILAGRVTFEVSARKKGSVFKVRAGNVKVTVVGTRFTVSKEKSGSVEVTVEHGVVDVQRADELASRLSGGDSIRMAPTLVPVEKPIEAQEAVAVNSEKEESPADSKKSVSDLGAVGPAVLRSKVQAAARTKRKTPIRRSNDKAKLLQRQPDVVSAIEPVVEVIEKAPTLSAKGERTKEQHRESVERVDVQATQTLDSAVIELKAIFKMISRANASVCILKLNAWLKRYPKHRKAVDARYAKGYCEFQRGNVRAANRIFSNLQKGNRWLRKVGDYMNPPKPR